MLKCIYRERAAISLFDALVDSENGGLSFPATTIRQVSLTIGRFRAIALDYGVPLKNVTLFATEAMRRAANAGTMLDAIRERAPGVAITILAPEVETLFGAMGARSCFVGVKGLFLDLGGGSVQMTYMDTTGARDAAEQVSYEIVAARTGQSLPFGAARLIKDLAAEDSSTSSSARKDEAKAARKDLSNGMLGAFARLSAQFPDLERAARKSDDSTGVDVYLCGGGFRGYGNMLMHNDPIQPYPIPLIGGYCAPGAFFAETKRMSNVNASTKDKIFGLSARRRKQFPAIIAVVDALVATVPKIKSVTFCAGGNREGALMMKLPRSIRESDPLDIFVVPAPQSLSSTAIPKSSDVAAALVATIRSAMPSNVVPDDIFASTLLLPLVTRTWLRLGESQDANASAAIAAVNDDPSLPGLGHQARASLAVALWMRWGGTTAPADEEALRNLKLLLGGEAGERCFWAEYVGAVAACVALVLPAGASSAEKVKEAVR